MTRWLRLYDDTINDPKILKLPEATRWHWVALLCIASKNDGALPALDDIAIQLRVTPVKATEILSALVKAGLIDKLETGFAPHNWNGRQYKSDVSTDRVKRFRNGKRNVSETEEKRPQRQIQNTEAESKKEPRDRALDWPEDFREQFWALYPNKVGKPKALSKLEGAMSRGVRWLDVMDGLHRYIQTKPPDRAWLNPETFINQERWTDQPANVSANNGKTGNIIAASDSLLDVIDRFERGSSDVDQIRSGEGAPPVRLLS